ncbi:MAG: tRNA (adenosine(37)-N6)-dimethylallyltransferase MiaA, partial [Bacteroidales bacterium]|nr:tRNA (adenosine(37)-N6)-dimethylallyltransferase MiaA [Bacteroidales bacterium]
MITLLGPTASGKTRLATQLAAALDGEILSADSRQVYKGMDIGTGKDLADYRVGDTIVPYHLIDLVDAGYKYNVFEYQHDFFAAWSDVQARGKQAILCGGTGLYLEAVLKGYKLVPVPPNPVLRAELEMLDLATLTQRLTAFKTLHNTTDVDTVKRAVRAIEIETYYTEHPELTTGFPSIPSLVFGLNLDREERRRRITERLHARLKEGLVEEVADL